MPKYLLIAALIEAQIQTGKWDRGRMPSIRGVAVEHSISVVTASRALQVLRDKGLIQTIERSGCYRVPAADADRWAILLHTTPGPWQRLTTTVIREGFESLARRTPMHLGFDTFAVVEGITKEQAKDAVKAAAKDGVQGIVLLPNRISSGRAAAEAVFLKAAEDAGLSVVLLERNLRGADGPLDRDLVTSDDFSGGLAGTRHLLEMGCKRIGIVIASPTSSHQCRLAGYIYGLHCAASANTRKLRIEETVLTHDINPDRHASYRSLCDRILDAKLDGVHCYADYTAVGVILELQQRKIRIPEEIAVMGYDNLPVGDLLPQGLTTYRSDTDSMVEQAIRLLVERRKNQKKTPVNVVVPGELIIRGSTVRS